VSKHERPKSTNFISSLNVHKHKTTLCKQKQLIIVNELHYYYYYYYYTRLKALFPGLPGSASTRKVKPIWILLKQETVSGSGISWTICKSAPLSRQITTPITTTQFYRLDALPAAQPTASKQ